MASVNAALPAAAAAGTAQPWFLEVRVTDVRAVQPATPEKLVADHYTASLLA
jgi:hypothetical protein